MKMCPIVIKCRRLIYLRRFHTSLIDIQGGASSYVISKEYSVLHLHVARRLSMNSRILLYTLCRSPAARTALAAQIVARKAYRTFSRRMCALSFAECLIKPGSAGPNKNRGGLLTWMISRLISINNFFIIDHLILTFEPRQIVVRNSNLLDGIGQALQVLLFILLLFLCRLLWTFPEINLHKT